MSWYRTGGLAAVLHRVPGHGAPGHPSRLTPDQQQALLAETATGAFRTYHEARDWVEQAFGVVYSYQGIYTLLDRLEVHPNVPRPQAAISDPVFQDAWKKGGLPQP